MASSRRPSSTNSSRRAGTEGYSMASSRRPSGANSSRREGTEDYSRASSRRPSSANSSRRAGTEDCSMDLSRCTDLSAVSSQQSKYDRNPTARPRTAGSARSVAPSRNETPQYSTRSSSGECNSKHVSGKETSEAGSEKERKGRLGTKRGKIVEWLVTLREGQGSEALSNNISPII